MDNGFDKRRNFAEKVKEVWDRILISIRTSILTLFTTLTISIGLLMILIHYYVSSSLLLQSAENLLQVSSPNIEKEVNNFIKPAVQNIQFATALIKKNLISPKPTKEFTSFLLANISDYPEYSAAYWGNNKGDFYIVERHSDQTFLNEKITVIGDRKLISASKLDADGNYISEFARTPVEYDPRLRPWYVKTAKEKKVTVSDIYLFQPWGENQPVLGLTFASPVYDRQKNLLGVFAIDLKLKSLSDFITQLHITDSASIFLFDRSDGTLIAAKNLTNFSGTKLPKISSLQPNWAYAAVQEYEKHKKPLFYYEFAKEKYLAFFDIIAKASGDEIFMAIALPVKDIIGPLNAKLIYSTGITIFILLIGMIFVGLASNSISRPIIRLANETKYIKHLDLSFTSKVRSHIREIVYMKEAFAVMMQSLRSFVSYVPLTVVKKLVETGDIAHVGGENKLATFLFSDITGFTSIAEKMDPHKLMIYLSEYLEAMTRSVLDKGGTVDKYIGDALMAFWGAPTDDARQADHACQCALAMGDCLKELNRHWKNRGYPEIKMRIGISTGNAIIGNVGSKDRLNYTAIGDCVNVANRLEELNKVYDTKIIVSDATYNIVKDKFSFRILDFTAVRGKHGGLFIYELLPRQNQFGSKLNEYNNAFKTAFDIYKKGDWEKAFGEFRSLTELYPEDALIKMYLERCQHLMQHQPKEWDGIWRK